MTGPSEIRWLPGGATELLLTSPILSTDLLQNLAETLENLAAEGNPLVISSSHPTIFLAGAHLAEIAALNMGSSLAYARLGRKVLERLRRFPAPVVAAVHGTCAGGGLDLVLSCDVAVASPRASFAHPGVHRGLVTGWGGTAMFPAVGGAGAAGRLFLEGRFFSAEEASAADWVTSLNDDTLGAARREVLRLASLTPARLELWRRFRHGRFVDRSCVSVVHTCWRLFRMEMGARV